MGDPASFAMAFTNKIYNALDADVAVGGWWSALIINKIKFLSSQKRAVL